jgi:uncharacterized protein YbjT (DUF2867 family)
MTTPILVTGGTGTLGRPVVRRLREAGATVTVLSRRPRETAEGIRYISGDLSTGEGIEAAVRGAEVIVHCAGSRKGDEQKTRTLVGAAKHARHIVLISVVGADRVPQGSAIDRALFGYFGMKLATERVVEQSGVGWTTLRATQFYDLILIVAKALAKPPVIPDPTGFRFQPVDAGEVAERMAELALGEPCGLVPDMAGPKMYTLAEELPQPGWQAAAAGPGAYSRPGRQGAPGRGEPGPGSRCRQADVGGLPDRPDLDAAQRPDPQQLERRYDALVGRAERLVTSATAPQYGTAPRGVAHAHATGRALTLIRRGRRHGNGPGPWVRSGPVYLVELSALAALFARVRAELRIRRCGCAMVEGLMAGA